MITVSKSGKGFRLNHNDTFAITMRTKTNWL